MTKDEMLEQRYAILFEALLLGIPIKVDRDWDIVLNRKNILLEVCATRRPDHEEITRNSSMTVNELLRLFNSISYHDLKTIFGNIRLHKLQKRLIAEGK